jgi:hypothetical protein
LPSEKTLARTYQNELFFDRASRGLSSGIVERLEEFKTVKMLLLDDLLAAH